MRAELEGRVVVAVRILVWEEVGVIAVRGPTVMQGYRQERHNAGAFLPGGWLNTGDLGYVDRTATSG